ncbi:MAG: IS110 family transposase [Candidatus Didemnitutus sp.]|nr:IS110 family transposase [Candidatus Didemnitutus sp.]
MNAKQITIGIDLGDRRHAVCVLSAAGKILAELEVVNTSECLAAFAQRYPRALFVMETGTHSPWVSRLLEARGHHVIVANARKLRAISTSLTKCDEADARMLARLGRADPVLLSPVKHRSEATQRALVQLKVREALVRSRVNQMNSVRFLVKSLGLQVARGIKATAFVRQFRVRADAATCALVEPLLQTIDALNAQLKQLDAQLATLATEHYPMTERLQQIAGVGPLTSLCFVLTVESPARFPCTRDVGAYLGLVPRRDQSGASDKQLPITKAGHQQLRCLLVNCAHYILGPFGPPSRLREAGERIAARGGKSAKKRAVIAVARKLAVTLLALWKTNSTYQPLALAA